MSLWSSLLSAANFLRINVYLTQKIGEDMLWNIAVNDVGADYDPLTLLRSRTMFGRPDWMSIYGKMRQAIEAGLYIPGSKSQLKTRVGVSKLFLAINFASNPRWSHRHTSVGPALLPNLLRKLPFITAVPLWSSLLLRSAYSLH
jgi:hypothetical protein